MATEAWITVVVGDLSHYLAASAMTALRESALGGGQSDPFTEHMPSVIATVRAYIQGCERNVLSETANSIPRSLKQVTCLMIIEAMQGRLPGVSLTESQQKMLERGVKMLEAIAACDIPVANPEDPEESTAQIGPDPYLISSTEQITSREQMSGL